MGFSGVEAFLNLMPAAPVPFEIQLPAAIAAAIDDAAIDGQLNNFPNIANPAPDNIVVNDVHPQLHMLAIEWYPEKNPVPLDGQVGGSKNLKRVFVEELDNSSEDQSTKRLKLSLEEETTHQETNLSLPPPSQVDLNPITPQPSVQEENSDDLNT
uniref:Uncharacterized protein n=1 Tax=Meloidogyne javanica TaxID=6303 RepID=A0A915MQ06_MELJA